MNNDDRFRKLVVDYLKSDRMPQHDDKQDDGFENIIKIQADYRQKEVNRLKGIANTFVR